MASMGPIECWKEQSHEIWALLELPLRIHNGLSTCAGTKCPPSCSIGLTKHFDDLFNDMHALKSKYICLVEIWIDQKETNFGAFEVPGKDFTHASSGKGKGCAIFSDISLDSINDLCDVIVKGKYQMLVFIEGKVQLVLLYLSKTCPIAKVANKVEEFLQKNFVWIVTGDFNFDAKEENHLTRLLAANNLEQLITEPTKIKEGQCTTAACQLQ